MLSFFPRDVLDEICDLIESVSEGFPSYSCKCQSQPMAFKMSGIDIFLRLHVFRGTRSFVVILAGPFGPV